MYVSNKIVHHYNLCFLGPCYNNSQNLKCDLIGRFKPLQCFKNHSECWCVDPINGTEINNTRIEIDEYICSKPPKCIDKSM